LIILLTSKGYSLSSFYNNFNVFLVENNASTELQQGKKVRLYSLDVLRGFDMFWIIGGGSLIVALSKTPGLEWLQGLAAQMKHVPWIGFHFWELIFPLFMFVSGVALPFSVTSSRAKGFSNKKLVLKGVKRMLLLIICGLLYNGLFRDGFANARYASVLGQIGIAYFFTLLIFLFTKSLKTRIGILSSILVAVALVQLFVPVPGIGAGVFTPEGCINGYIDRMLLPGRLGYGVDGMVNENGIYDALGWLSIVSAIGITLMGTFAGTIFQNENIRQNKKVKILSIIGIVLVIAGLALSPVYPLIKNCWTTTYNLVAGGISFLLMALFYLVVDVWQYRRWTTFFVVIGMNSLFVYLFASVVPISTIVQAAAGWFIKISGDAETLVKAVLNLIFLWFLLYFMYKRKIFVKV
jgi:predicted acyltransferase